MKGENVKNSWLRWVRKDEGDVQQFLTDVKRYGPAVPVSLVNLKRLSWQDDVYCMAKPPGAKGAAVFMSFPVRIVSGLSEAGREALSEFCGMDQIMPGGLVKVERQIGTYSEGATYTINANMQEIADALRSATNDGADVGLVMVGAGRNSYTVLDLPWPVLSEGKSKTGLRQFDAQDFLRDVMELDLATKSLINADLPGLPGKYPIKTSPTKIGEGQIEVAVDFHKREEPEQETFDFAAEA